MWPAGFRCIVGDSYIGSKLASGHSDNAYQDAGDYINRAHRKTLARGAKTPVVRSPRCCRCTGIRRTPTESSARKGHGDCVFSAIPGKTNTSQSVRISSFPRQASSENSADSSYVTFEWAYGLGNGKTVVPVRLENCTVHPRLEPIQHLDFSVPGRSRGTP